MPEVERVRASPITDGGQAGLLLCAGLLQLAYRSVAVSDFGPLHLFYLLRETERANHRQGITGHLQYRCGVFTQFLEGPAPAVERVWSRIQKDRRHRSIELMCKRHGESRKLVDWSMSFAAPPAYERLGVPGFIALHENSAADAILRSCLS